VRGQNRIKLPELPSCTGVPLQNVTITWKRVTRRPAGTNQMAKKSKSTKQESVELSAAGNEFAAKWLQRFGLPSAWEESARSHLEQLCFSDSRETFPLIESLFDIVPGILNRKPERKCLAEAYAWCCYAFWQCESAFPAFPETFASFLLEQLQTNQGRNLEISTLLASLLADAEDVEAWGGINRTKKWSGTGSTKTSFTHR
jgi:hypothetical protein